MPIKTLADVTAIEQTPLWQRIAATSVYEQLQAVAARLPELLALRAVATTHASEAPRDITFREFLKKITQVANLLTSLGVGPTDVVSLMVPLVPESYFALFGATAAGVANPLNPLLEPAHLIGIMRQTATAVLVATADDQAPEVWAKVEALRAALPGLKAVLRIGGTGSAPEGVLDLAAAIASQPDDHLIAQRSTARSDLAVVFHTGGTTGQPKLARHTHGGLLAAGYAHAAAISDEPGNLLMAGLPLFHIGGALITGLFWLAAGNCVVLPTPGGLRNPKVIRDYWQVVERLRPNFIGGVPTSLGALVEVPEQGHDRSLVRFCLTGASALPVEVGRRFAQRFGVPVIEGYGMTEVHGYATLNPLLGEVRLGSVGLRLPYLELCIAEVSAEGAIVRRCATNEVGHVLMRGPQIFAGYVDARNNRGVLLADGWLDSGDLGRLDADGYLWLTGRSKELIIRGGHNIDPGLIEQTLHQHPAVALVAAVPAPDTYAGELPVAFVQLRTGQQATADELLAFCRQHIAERAATPVEVWLDLPLPLTAMGKIFKPALRLEAARRVFAREVAKLREAGIDAHVHVQADPTHGTLVKIVVHASGGLSREDIQSRCRQQLGGYQLKHEVVYAEPQEIS